MNRNQVEGKVKEVAGKVQQRVGEATGSTNQKVKGVAKQVEGKVQKGVGDAQQAVTDASKRRKDARILLMPLWRLREQSRAFSFAFANRLRRANSSVLPLRQVQSGSRLSWHRQS
jgi:uncharacterized protein YjbJ (UPF0337 family)